MRAIVVGWLLIVSLFASDNIQIFTEHYPPYNMRIDGKIIGSSVEILDAIFKELKSSMSIEKNVKLTNWSRGYSIAQIKPNAMIFSTTRTKGREKLFKWVGPIAKTTVGLISLKSKHIKIKNVEDLNNYKIGAVLKDVGELLLLEKGVKKQNIKYVKGQIAINISFNMLKKGRIDMFSYNTTVAFNNARKNGFDSNKYENVYVLASGELYFAFNKNIDDKIIQKWQKALDKLKQNGTYMKILNKYTK